MLEIFDAEKINLSRIESRPRRGERWQYVFFTDLEGHRTDGNVTRAQIISDRETGRSRGFGFVEMAEGGDEAISNLNGAMFQGRALTVNEAKPREERPRTGTGGGDRGSRSSFGGSRRY